MIEEVSIDKFTNELACNVIANSAIEFIRKYKTCFVRLHTETETKRSIEVGQCLTREELDTENYHILTCDNIQCSDFPEGITRWFTEMVVDTWLKLGATQFMCKYNPETKKLLLYVNKIFTSEQFDAYWNSHRYDGYELTGEFWNREWNVPQRQTHGGKVE